MVVFIECLEPPAPDNYYATSLYYYPKTKEFVLITEYVAIDIGFNYKSVETLERYEIGRYKTIEEAVRSFFDGYGYKEEEIKEEIERLDQIFNVKLKAKRLEHRGYKVFCSIKIGDNFIRYFRLPKDVRGFYATYYKYMNDLIKLLEKGEKRELKRIPKSKIRETLYYKYVENENYAKTLLSYNIIYGEERKLNDRYTLYLFLARDFEQKRKSY